MRILAVSPVYWPCVGGGERLLGRILEHMAGRGHCVTVLTMDAGRLPDLLRTTGSGLPPREVHNGVQIMRFPPGGGWPGRAMRVLTKPRGATRSFRAVSAHWSELFLTTPSAVGLIPNLARDRADLVLSASWWSSIPLMGVAIGHARRIPVVALPLLHTAQPWSSRKILRAMSRRCTSTVALTPSEASFQEALGSPDAHVIGCGIDPHWGDSADGISVRERLNLGDRPVVGFIGRQDAGKGTPTVVDAMRIVWRSRPDAVLLLAGMSAHRDAATVASISRLSTAERGRVVECSDFADGEAPSIVAACDLLAQPSREESFGLVLLEAWLMGRPVIGADIPATRDLVVDGDDGLIVPPSSPVTLADAILRLIGAPELRRRMGDRGRDKVLSRYSTQEMLDRWEALVDQQSRFPAGRPSVIGPW